jgi:hypothetical protein
MAMAMAPTHGMKVKGYIQRNEMNMLLDVGWKLRGEKKKNRTSAHPLAARVPSREKHESSEETTKCTRRQVSKPMNSRGGRRNCKVVL